MLRATALAIALAPTALPAATILADFENAAPAAGSMRVAGIGTGACAAFAGSTRALCGADVDAMLRFDGLDFDGIDSIALDLGAAAVGDRFDRSGDNGD